MPVVRSFRRQQETAPAPAPQRSRVPIGQVETPLLRAAPTAASFGAPIGEALGQIGGAFRQAQLDERAREIQEANKKQEKELQEAKDRQNRIAIFEADNKLATASLDILFNKQTGLTTREGKNAFGAPQVALDQYDKAFGEVWQSLSNDEQRDAVAQLSHTRRKELHGNAVEHEAKQMKVFEQQQFVSYMDNSATAALAHFDNAVNVGNEIERQRSMIFNHGILNGLGDEWIKSTMAKAESATQSGVIKRYLSVGRDQEAENYFKNWEKQILPADAVELAPQLITGSREGKAARIGNELWDKLGPKRETEEAKLRVLLDAAREYEVSDSKLFKSIEIQLRSRTAIWNDGVKQDDDAMRANVVKAVLADATIDQIRVMPEFLSASQDRQNEITKMVADKLKTVNDLAKSSADYLRARRWEAESQAHTREGWAKQDKEEAALAEYYNFLEDPDTFDKGVTENQIIIALPMLGRNLMNDLLRLHRERAKPDKKLAVTIDDDIFNQAARDAGLEPDKRVKTDAERAVLGALMNYGKQRIAEEQARPGRTAELDRGEKQAIMEQAILGVLPAAHWWSSGKRAFEVYDSIPAAERTLIEQEIRRMNAEHPEMEQIPVNPATITKLYLDKTKTK